MSFKKVCKVCGREFHSAKYSSRFCSENCYVKAKNWDNETRYLLDKEGDNRTHRKSKSDAVKVASGSENSDFKIVINPTAPREFFIPKVCAYCGKEFVAQRVTTMFCGNNCAKKYRNKQELEERHKRITAETIKQNIAIRDMNSPDAEYIRMIDACCIFGSQQAYSHALGNDTSVPYYDGSDRHFVL